MKKSKGKVEAKKVEAATPIKNVTAQATTGKFTSNKIYKSTDNLIVKLVKLILFPLFWLASLIGNLLIEGLKLGDFFCGCFLMGASAYICTENYYQLLNYGVLADSLRAFLNDSYTALSVLTAFFIFYTVEHFQSSGWIAWVAMQNRKKVSGVAGFDPAIATGIIATVCEFFSMLYRFWWQGFDFISVVSIFVGLFGFKVGFGMFQKFQKSRSSSANQEIPEPPAPSFN